MVTSAWGLQFASSSSVSEWRAQGWRRWFTSATVAQHVARNEAAFQRQRVFELFQDAAQLLSTAWIVVLLFLVRYAGFGESP